MPFDLDVFDAIVSQTTTWDRHSLLAVRSAVQAGGPYCYLEIGSYMGGSLQPWLCDPCCTRIYSIDKRPRVARDNRRPFKYGCTTEIMLRNLRNVPNADLSKLQTIEGDTRDIDPGLIEQRPIVCFIDGEHTDAAVVSDYQFCRRVMASDGLVLFHDVGLIYRALMRICSELVAAGTRSYQLPSSIFAIEFGNFRIQGSSALQAVLQGDHQGFLDSFDYLDGYRRFCEKPDVRAILWLHRLLGWLSGRGKPLSLTARPSMDS